MKPRQLTITLGITLATLLLGLTAGTYLFAGSLKKQGVVLANDKAKIEQLTAQEKGISKSKSDIAKYSELQQITKSIVPQDKDQAATVREITAIATASKVPLTTISFPTSTLGSSPSGAKTTVAVASAAATATPNLSQLTPVKGLVGVYNLQITLGNNAANTVTYKQLLDFLQRLENNRRTAAVASINIQPQPADPNNLVFNLIINTYIKP